jgi:hypothetical protein
MLKTNDTEKQLLAARKKQSERAAAWRLANPEKAKENNRAWNKAHPAEAKNITKSGKKRTKRNEINNDVNGTLKIQKKLKNITINVCTTFQQMSIRLCCKIKTIYALVAV